jgi:phenylalanyl-tRNA synthetase alpha subunit
MTKKNNDVNNPINPETPSYGFYSKLLNKPFDSLSELMAAEKAYNDEQALKEEKALAKKADAKKVEDAFKTLNSVKREFNAAVIEARKIYNNSVAAAKKAYETAIAEATNLKNTAEETYDSILKDFIKKHPEGYHLTLKDGDNVVTYSSQSDMINFMKDHVAFNNLLDSILNLW